MLTTNVAASSRIAPPGSTATIRMPAITGPRMFDMLCVPPNSALASCRRSDSIVSGRRPFIAGQKNASAVP